MANIKLENKIEPFFKFDLKPIFQIYFSNSSLKGKNAFLK